MTKLPVQKRTQGTTQNLLQHHDATYIVEKLYFCIFRIFLFFKVYVNLNNYIVYVYANVEHHTMSISPFSY